MEPHQDGHSVGHHLGSNCLPYQQTTMVDEELWMGVPKITYCLKKVYINHKSIKSFSQKYLFFVVFALGIVKFNVAKTLIVKIKAH